ncbi:hypothetical protein EPR50_G00228060 [Perca flavescens]|uniref:Uncharacterized protein n=1 Tax=Perca flavescens TaxID=8167 RepID=A0A484C1B6_PERFV|nr:hypothetical protein EPR50_G00228060 [Perca flavescens]
MIQESDGRRRKEVGCQWESPEEERKEVGSQSDSAESRDAAVQVDLLTQQLSWTHTVRADDPAGGSLLHHCTHHSRPVYLLCCCPPAAHTLPTMHQLGAPAPPDPQPCKECPSLPSMPLCGVSPTAGRRTEAPTDASGPPAGLIAPLSEEEEEKEEEEEEKGLCKKNEKRKPPTLTAEKKSSGEKRTNHIAGEVQPDDDRKSNRCLDVIQSEERSSVGSETQIQRTQTQRGGNTGATDGGEDGVMEEEEVKPLKKKAWEARWPRRKAVGPPIRYLLESEEPSAANHSKARGAKGKRREEGRSLRRTNSSVRLV